MRNLKKLTAIMLVSTMCIGAAFTSFAAEADGSSPANKPLDVEGVTITGALDKDGNEVPVTTEEITEKEVVDTLTNEESLKDILGSKYQVGASDRVTVLAAGDINVVGEMPEGGIDFTMAIVDGDVKPGNTVYVLHQKDDGTWEVFEAVIDADGNITVHLDSLSPVAVVKVMSDGSVKVLSEKTETVTSEKKSPKTGE